MNLGLSQALKLLILIKERNVNETIERIRILSTALMEDKARNSLVDGIQSSFTIEDVETQETDYKALDRLKTQMNGGEG